MCIRWPSSGRPALQSYPGICESLAWSALAFIQNLIPGAMLLAWPSFAASAKLTPRLRVRIAQSSLSSSDSKADYNNAVSSMRAGRDGTQLACQRWQTRWYLDSSPQPVVQPGNSRASLHALAPVFPEIACAVCEGEFGLCIFKKATASSHDCSMRPLWLL